MTLKGVFPGDRIAEVQTLPDRLPDQKDLPSGRDLPFLAPGFLDMQVNGAMITTSPKERILRNLRTLPGALAADRNLRSAIPGIHIEGPFISGLDGPRGAGQSGALPLGRAAEDIRGAAADFEDHPGGPGSVRRLNPPGLVDELQSGNQAHTFFLIQAVCILLPLPGHKGQITEYIQPLIHVPADTDHGTGGQIHR
jgi:hypothetical protein